jgi:N-acetyl-alpha-D-muramate 1-phosphate uridylyltransferase
VGDVVAVVLAAGAGTRLAPLTIELPKPLCPVGEHPLLDLALRRLEHPGLESVTDVVVNVHHHASAIIGHLQAHDGASGGPDDAPADMTGPAWRLAGLIGGDDAGDAGAARDAGHAGDDGPDVQVRRRLWVSHERDQARGTAGAIGHLRTWLDGRGVLVVNGDTWTEAPLPVLLDGWDRTSARVLVVGGTFGPGARVAGALVPWDDVMGLPDTPAGLYEHCWADHARAGTLDVLTCDARFVDCGTPADYLAANMLATGGASSVAASAQVHGAITRCVVWPGAVVEAGEVLVDAVRTTSGRTVLVRTQRRVGGATAVAALS